MTSVTNVLGDEAENPPHRISPIVKPCIHCAKEVLVLKKLGEILLRQKLITREQLQAATKAQEESGYRLGYQLVKLGFIQEKDLMEALSLQYGVPSLDLSRFEMDEDLIRRIPADIARKYQVIPVSRTGARLTVAMIDPTNLFAMDTVKFRTGYDIEPVVVTESAMETALDRYYGSTLGLELKEPESYLAEIDDAEMEVLEEAQEIDLDEIQKGSEEAPVIQLCNQILGESVRRGASDIHIEPFEKELRVRLRVDGVLSLLMRPPMKIRHELTSRLKIMAQLDIAERRLPQGGRIKLRMRSNDKTREIEFRVSVLPTLFGEKVVLRLLDKESLQLDMTQLGFEPASLRRFEEAISKPWGMVLVTGPTGSGKTNTLYSAISRLNTMETNIMTAEDPVEFNLLGINQVQVNEDIGLNFANALRTFLRQDPNIILVGEIRDFETAEISVKGALTGHMVLSTLHTNDAPSTINRLMNMGIEPFLVATSVHLICAQRLIRRVCKECRKPTDVPARALIDIGFAPEDAKNVTVFKGRGCQACNNTGYRGRLGLFEVFELSDRSRQLILEGASAIELRRQAVEEGMITLRQSGLVKIRDGLTTIEEVVRETVS